jgi:hypothetical protein
VVKIGFGRTTGAVPDKFWNFSFLNPLAGIVALKDRKPLLVLPFSPITQSYECVFRSTLPLANSAESPAVT